MKKLLFILTATTICTIYLVGMGAFIPVEAKEPPTENLPVINQDTALEQDSNDRVTFKVKGIDYSTKIAQIIVTIDEETYASTLDPISLLDPHDDSNGVIRFSMLIPEDSIKSGSSYTACIRILEDADSFGNSLACHSGSTAEMYPLSENQTQQVDLYL